VALDKTTISARGQEQGLAWALPHVSGTIGASWSSRASAVERGPSRSGRNQAAQKPLTGFLIHPSSRGGRSPPPAMTARQWEHA
jgi:hypothetical protein